MDNKRPKIHVRVGTEPQRKKNPKHIHKPDAQSSLGYNTENTPDIPNKNNK